MTDLKTAATTTPETPVDEKAKTVAPASEPMTQPEPAKVAPEATPAKQS